MQINIFNELKLYVSEQSVRWYSNNVGHESKAAIGLMN